MRLSARNSGLFFIAATEEVLRMMSRLKRRMETEGVWDQTAYNEEMWCSTLEVPSLAAPQLGSCGSSGRAWRLWGSSVRPE